MDDLTKSLVHERPAPEGEPPTHRQTSFFPPEVHAAPPVVDFRWKDRAIAQHARSVKGIHPVNSREDKEFLALALCGEAGELANLTKKVKMGYKISEVEIQREIADIRVYLYLLERAYEMHTPSVVTQKLNEFDRKLEVLGK